MKKRTDGRIEYLARIRRLGQEDDGEGPMVIVQAEPDSRNNNKIRIITAYYTENPKLLIKYHNHYEAVVNSHNKEVTDNYTFEGTSPEQLKEMWDEYKARQLAWEEANNHKDI
jgi:hypothetical protein